MDELPSTEFRKRFARLTAPTVVTVNGHPIGVWSPADRPFPGLSVPEVRAIDGTYGQKDAHGYLGPYDVGLEAPEVRPRTHTGHRDGNPGAASDRFSTRPFTPVPKGK